MFANVVYVALFFIAHILHFEVNMIFGFSAPFKGIKEGFCIGLHSTLPSHPRARSQSRGTNQ